MEINYKGEIYALKAGMGFIRSINKKVVRTLDSSMKGKDLAVGLTFYAIQLYAGSIEALYDVILELNACAKGPKLKPGILDEYFEDEETDIDALFDEVIDFLSKANVCKKEMKQAAKSMGVTETQS